MWGCVGKQWQLPNVSKNREANLCQLSQLLFSFIHCVNRHFSNFRGEREREERERGITFNTKRQVFSLKIRVQIHITQVGRAEGWFWAAHNPFIHATQNNESSLFLQKHGMYCNYKTHRAYTNTYVHTHTCMHKRKKDRSLWTHDFSPSIFTKQCSSSRDWPVVWRVAVAITTGASLNNEI